MPSPGDTWKRESARRKRRKKRRAGTCGTGLSFSSLYLLQTQGGGFIYSALLPAGLPAGNVAHVHSVGVPFRVRLSCCAGSRKAVSPLRASIRHASDPLAAGDAFHCSLANQRALRTPRLIAVSAVFLLAADRVSHRTAVHCRRAVRSTAESLHKG